MLSGQYTITSLKAVNITGLAAGTLALVVDGNRSGSFQWVDTNQSARITEQTVDTTVYEGIFVAPDSQTNGTDGAWERIFDGPIDPSWFTMDIKGGTPASPATNAGALQAAFNIGAGMFSGLGCTVKVPPGALVIWDGEVAVPDFSVLDMRGVTVRKGFNGDMARLGQFVEVYASLIYGKNGTTTHTGRGFVVDGNGDQLIDAYMQDFDGHCVDCLPGKGLRMRIIGRTFKRTDPREPAIRFPYGSANGNRTIEGCFGDTLLDVRGTDNFVVSDCNFKNILMGGFSRKGRFTGNRMAIDSLYPVPFRMRGVQHAFGDDNVVATPQFIIEDDLVGTITTVTKADPAVASFTASGEFFNGDIVLIDGVSGMTELNGKRYLLRNVLQPTTGNFTAELYDPETETPIDSSGFTDPGTGGSLTNEGATDCAIGNFVLAAGSPFINKQAPDDNEIVRTAEPVRFPELQVGKVLPSPGETGVDVEADVSVYSETQPQITLRASNIASSVTYKVSVSGGYSWQDNASNITGHYLDCDIVYFRDNDGNEQARKRTDGWDLSNSGTYRVNGTTVVGPRVINANLGLDPAAGVQERIDLLNALKNLVIAHGLGRAS